MPLNYESSDKIELSSIVKIFKNTISIKSKSETGEIAIINSATFTKTGIDYKKLSFCSETNEKLSKYFLQDNDVLLLSSGPDNKVAIFKKQNYPCVSEKSLSVLRPDEEKINPNFLCAFLQGSIGKSLLKNIQTGASLVTINQKALGSIQIPFWSLKEQAEWLKANN